MSPGVTLSRLRDELEELSYPIERPAAADELREVTVQYADGEEPKADVVGRANADEFASAEELESEIYSTLPTEAVGEPGQSEGKVSPDRRAAAPSQIQHSQMSPSLETVISRSS